MRAPWKTGSSSQLRPSQLKPSRMTRVCSSDERSLSVSSMRSRNVPPEWRGESQVKKGGGGAPARGGAGGGGGEGEGGGTREGEGGGWTPPKGDSTPKRFL